MHTTYKNRYWLGLGNIIMYKSDDKMVNSTKSLWVKKKKKKKTPYNPNLK